MSMYVQQPIVTSLVKIAFNIEEAAEAIGASEPTVVSAISAGELLAYQLDRECVILAEDLIAFVRSRTRYTKYVDPFCEGSPKMIALEAERAASKKSGRKK